MMNHGSHHQVLPSTWAPDEDMNHFHSPKLSRDTRLHLPLLQPQSRAACLSPSSTGDFVVYHSRGRDIWPHTETRQSQGWTSWLLPIPQTFFLHHRCCRDLPCQSVGVTHLRGDAFRL